MCFTGLIIFLYFLQGLFDIATRGNEDRHKLLCKEVGRNGHDHDLTSELNCAPYHKTSNEGDITRQVTSQSCVKYFNLYYMFDCPVQGLFDLVTRGSPEEMRAPTPALRVWTKQPGPWRLSCTVYPASKHPIMKVKLWGNECQRYVLKIRLVENCWVFCPVHHSGGKLTSLRSKHGAWSRSRKMMILGNLDLDMNPS